MGKTIENLATRAVSEKAVFNNRFVVEACEQFHIHYRNLRLSLPTQDFIQVATGISDALARWRGRGSPENPKVHIELCRKTISDNADPIKINLNENLYNANAGRIFAEGSGFTEKVYVHLKTRDIRLEMSVKEFKELSNAVAEASKRLEDSTLSTVL